MYYLNRSHTTSESALYLYSLGYIVLKSHSTLPVFDSPNGDQRGHTLSLQHHCDTPASLSSKLSCLGCVTRTITLSDYDYYSRQDNTGGLCYGDMGAWERENINIIFQPR